jgi:hypothetical protein
MRVPQRVLVCVTMVGLCTAWSSAGAQRARIAFGGEWRVQIGSVDDTLQRRTGPAARVFVDGTLSDRWGWRLDGAYAQMKHDRTLLGESVVVSENNLEAGAGATFVLRLRGLYHPYIIAGGLYSHRASCGVDSNFDSNGFVACGNTDESYVGWNAGLGVRRVTTLAWRWFAEVRALGRVTSALGGNAVAVSAGLRF